MRLQGWAIPISHQTHERIFCSLVLWDVLKEAIDASLGKLQTLKTANPAESKGIFLKLGFCTWLINIAAFGIRHDWCTRSNRLNRCLLTDFFQMFTYVLLQWKWKKSLNSSSIFGLTRVWILFSFRLWPKKRLVTSHSLSHVYTFVDACIDLYSVLIFIGLLINQATVSWHYLHLNFATHK